ncbi:CynX/NimT family MFS transporter [Streptomyces sp. S465]|uniref:CynX/NimT family MFS transporter n=1 Tax=Streptomyces sp. S465 TaxID=2979468 RepID=UPI0022A877C1|nr:MFS transporter [Streptomyces sp. S465]WAP55270.1 MFS transporter [Streptomyces sp. S465]
MHTPPSDDLATLDTAASAPRPAQPGKPHRAASPWRGRVMAAGLLLAALNLRPAVTSLGPLLEEVRDDLGMSGTVAGVLTSVPAACFALFGFAAPRLARRRGPGAVVCAGLAAITAGLALRPLAGGTVAFLAASALALAGIAVSNVLMPVIVKRWFPDRVGAMTGLYSMGLSLGTAAAAAATVPMTDALGGSWRAGLAVWALLAAVALVPWLFLARDRASGPEADGPQADGPAAGGSGGSVVRGSAAGGSRADAPAGAGTPTPAGGTSASADGTSASAGGSAIRITRSPIAWAMAVFFGFQATAAYVSMGWMPQIFRDAGVSASTSGLLLAVMMAMGVPLAFVLPRIAARLRHQGVLVAILGAFSLIGYGGLWLAPAEGAWAWAVLLGVANCAFPLALTMISMRAKTHAGVVRLSAFAQSTGYLLSIPGPLLVGVLYQHSGGWGQPIALMAAFMVPQIIAGVLAGRPRTLEDEA